MTFARLISSSWIRVCVTSGAYLAASGVAVALTRFDGGAAFLWFANAVLLAALTTAHRRRWPALIVSCWIAGLLAACVWGLGWRAAPFISLINVAEPAVGALLVTHWRVHRSGLDSAANLSLFVLAAGVIAPVVSGIAGTALIVLYSPTGFWANYSHWVIGHALGALTFTPIFALAASGEVGRWSKSATLSAAVEASVLLLLVALTSIGVFAQSLLPMLFLPALPLMLITFRVGRIGSAMAIVVIAGIGIGLTLHGDGPVNLIHAGVGVRLQFLQFYLAATVMTVLPVAADLARRRHLFDQLRDSEARFRLLTESSTDIVLNLDVNGIIRYASPSIALLGGYDPQQLIGSASEDLVDPDDRERVRTVHLRALKHPNETFSVEYRGVVSGDEQRWFETRTRAVRDKDGIVRSVVSMVRDTSKRRLNEIELATAANTDPLTGIGNRRAFDRVLATRLAQADESWMGCVAIFDLDHFKQVNDRFGHAIGDEVLRAFARTAELQVRAGDMLARIGGEEFGLIFPDISVEQAYDVCERIREGVAATPVRAGNWPVLVTVSVGIGPLCRSDDANSAMRVADQALYLSKQKGRNCSSLAA